MCGILGTINLLVQNAELELIARRGPDDFGINAIDLGVHKIIMGHRRLSIVDLSPAGHQPMFDTSNSYCITYNGEVYNHHNLRSQSSNIQYRGHSDTETILYHLIQHGISGVSAFNGIFAFAFINKFEKKLYLVRDPFGVKPLYYKHENNSLIFCSELKPILSLASDEISKNNLSELLSLRYSASPSTLFKGIKKVRPGHLLEVDLNTRNITIHERSYLSFPVVRNDLPFEEAVEEYGKLLENSVERQLMADVELGVLLSGGVDSALVAKFANEKSNHRLKAFTVGFDKPGYADETQEAKESADIIGMDYMDVKIGFDNFLNTIKKCVNIVEEPSATTSIVPMYYLSELASEHVKVVLTGQGADEPLGGYRRYQGEILSNWIPSSLVSLITPLVKKLGVTSEVILRGLSSLSQPDDVLRFLSTSRVFYDDEITKLIGSHQNHVKDKINYFYETLDCTKKPNTVERMMSLDLRMNLSDDLLLYTDKISMHHSLECRVPMLDHDLISFIESLPAHYRVKLKQGKIIHKEFAKKILPSKIVNRTKKGFLSPTKEWFNHKEKLGELLLNNNSKFSTYFDTEYVERIIDQHIKGYNRERHIFLLLSTYYWIEEYG